MTGLSATGIPASGEAGPGVPPGPRASAGATLTAPPPAASRPGVAVVVCTYTEERWDDLARAIRSVQAQSEPAAEIILVVDHCQPLLRRARQELPGVRVMPNHFVRGLAGARNTGVAEASADVVAFLDDDAVADPDWIAELAGAYADTRVAGVGGTVKPAWDASRPCWFPPELDWVVGCSYRGQPAATGPVRNFIGANMSFRREILNDLAGFATSLGRVGAAPRGCEETELCLRVSQRYPESLLIHQPAAAVVHRVRRQRARWRYLWLRCYSEGRSKAAVASTAGARRALASERCYVRSQVPRALARSAAEAARGRLAGLLAAGAVASAITCAVAGFLAGTTRVAWRRYVPALGGWANSPAAVPWIGLCAALTLWGAALAQADIAGLSTSGLGLVTALPVTFWAAAGLLIVSFSAAVIRPATRWPALAGHLVALVAMLHATPVILYGTLRYSWAWKHIGVIDFITHHGIVFNLGGVLGPYQGWPAFFALNSFVSGNSGLSSALSYASWALPLNDLLWLGPVVVITRAFTSDRRLVWTAAWLFELANWVGQDYLSPQAFAFFLYLAVIAACLRWLWNPRVPEPARRPHRVRLNLAARRAGAGPSAVTVAEGSLLAVDIPPAGKASSLPGSTRLALVACLLPLMAAIAASHQLTPFMLIAALALLVVFGQLRPLVLPAVMALITIGWLLSGARPWLAANNGQIFAGLGNPLANSSSHLVGGSQVPFDQLVVEWGARLLSAVTAVVAAAGFFRYRRYHDAFARRSWNRTALLGLAAVPSVAANSYGGEIIFRAFLFALPFLAVTAAAAFFPHPGLGRRARSGVALAAVSLVLAAGFGLANYGQEAINYFTPSEVAASQWLYRTAPKGAEIVAANSNFPWAFVHYDWYTYAFLDSPPALGRRVFSSPVRAVTRIMRQDHSPAYLIFTTSQSEQDTLTGTWPPGTVGRVTRDLLASGKYRVVHRTRDAVILRLSAAPASQPAGGGR